MNKVRYIYCALFAVIAIGAVRQIFRLFSVPPAKMAPSDIVLPVIILAGAALYFGIMIYGLLRKRFWVLYTYLFFALCLTVFIFIVMVFDFNSLSPSDVAVFAALILVFDSYAVYLFTNKTGGI